MSHGFTKLNNTVPEQRERLIRLHTSRRGAAVELRIHYRISHVGGCEICEVLAVEDLNAGTSTH
jgi:hypothetical protein